MIDPGPADEAHLEAVRAAAEDRGGIAGVLLTHSHADHSAGACPCSGAPCCSARSERATRPRASPAPSAARPASRSRRARGAWARSRSCPRRGTRPTTSASCLGRSASAATSCSATGRASFRPTAARWPPTSTPWSACARADLELLCPGHGPSIEDPAAKIDEYLEHRLMRERRLLAALERGERSRARLLDRVWDDVPDGAAAGGGGGHAGPPREAGGGGPAADGLSD